MYDKLKELPYIKYVDRPSGQYLHSIDLSIVDVNYLDNLKHFISDNNWYLESGYDRSFTITQKYIRYYYFKSNRR